MVLSLRLNRNKFMARPKKQHYEDRTFWTASQQSETLIKRALLYCTKHNMTKTELTRNALVFYLDYVQAPRFADDDTYRNFEDSELARINAEIAKLQTNL